MTELQNKLKQVSKLRLISNETFARIITLTLCEHYLYV